MNTLGRTLAGAGMGIVAATLAWPAMFSVANGGRTGMTFSHMLTQMPEIFFIQLVFAGPGALLLSWIHASMMARWARRTRTRREIRIAGIVLGILLGVANLMLTFEAVGLLWGAPMHERLFTTQMTPYLIPAAAGGVGAGWGVTLGLKPGLPEEK